MASQVLNPRPSRSRPRSPSRHGWSVSIPPRATGIATDVPSCDRQLAPILAGVAPQPSRVSTTPPGSTPTGCRKLYGGQVPIRHEQARHSRKSSQVDVCAQGCATSTSGAGCSASSTSNIVSRSVIWSRLTSSTCTFDTPDVNRSSRRENWCASPPRRPLISPWISPWSANLSRVKYTDAVGTAQGGTGPVAVGRAATIAIPLLPNGTPRHHRLRARHLPVQDAVALQRPICGGP